MDNSLQAVFDAIANTQNEQELRSAMMDIVGKHFDVEHWGFYLFDSESVSSINISDIPAVCLESNPVGRYVFERHAPAHEQLVLPQGDWKHFCTRQDHEHVMSGPIVYAGRLVGTLNLARATGTPAFNANDLADLSALCIHLSAKIATLRSSVKINSSLANRLTPRELEIAELVAQGLTNGEIGTKLWITHNSVKQALKRMFRKLEVSARTEMVAKLQDVL